MIRAKHFIFVGFGAMAALTIYGAAATKTASLGGGHKDRLARIEALMDEGGAKYRPSFFRHTVKHTEVRIAGLEPVKTVTEVAAPVAPVVAKPDPKAEEAKKAAEKKAADDKKKKEDEAKKKKKKKKKKGEKQEEAAPSAPQDEAKKDDEKKEDPTATAATGGTTVSYAGNVGVANPNPQTYEEWIQYLTLIPSTEKINKFIQLAQVNNVKPDVFYPVCEKLITMDGKLPEYGILALGSVTSVTSFEDLAAVANEASVADKLKSQATAYMNMYTRFEYIRFLGAAALSKDAVAAADAIQLIERALPTLRAMATASASQTPGASAGTRAPASSLAAIYKQIYANLETAGTSGADYQVRTSAQAVAPQIASILSGLSPADPTAVTPDPTKQVSLAF